MKSSSCEDNSRNEPRPWAWTREDLLKGLGEPNLGIACCSSLVSPLPHNHRCERRQFCSGLSLSHTPGCHRMPDPRAVGSDCHMICSFYFQPSTPFLGWHLWWLLTFNRRRKAKPAPKPFGICFPLSAMMAGLETSTHSGAAMSSRYTGLFVPISHAFLGKVTA